MRERLWEGASDELCRACHEATRGNALLVEQVIVGLRQSGKPLMEIAVGDIDGVAAEGISAGVMARIAPLGPAARALAEATAVLGSRAEPRHAAALAQLEPDRAERVADGLRTAGILAPGRVLEFVHPLIRTSIYDAIPVGERSSAHAVAARLLAAEDADPGAVAAHLLHAPRHGDADAVARLQAAAAASLAQGAADRAVDYLRRALEEPPTPDLRPMVLFALGAAEASANDPAAADTLDRARRLATDPMLKRGVSLSMGGVLIAAGRHDELMDIVDEELDQLGDDDAALTAAFETFLLATMLASPPDRPLSERAQGDSPSRDRRRAPPRGRAHAAGRPRAVRAELRGPGRGGRGAGRPVPRGRSAPPRASRRLRAPVPGARHPDLVRGAPSAPSATTTTRSPCRGRGT